MNNLRKDYLAFFTSKEQRPSFCLLDGTGKVLVSAPHSVEQTREGKIKYGEYETGVLARLLHDQTNCPVIFKTFNSNDDANYDEISSYKEALKKYVNKNDVRYVLDLHQLAPARAINIDLGTGLGKNISVDLTVLEFALRRFRESGISNISLDSPFDASYPFTVSSFISRECGISCLQVEMNTRLLCEDYDDCCFWTVFSALQRIIADLEGANNDGSASC